MNADVLGDDVDHIDAGQKLVKNALKRHKAARHARDLTRQFDAIPPCERNDASKEAAEIELG